MFCPTLIPRNSLFVLLIQDVIFRPTLIPSNSSFALLIQGVLVFSSMNSK